MNFSRKIREEASPGRMRRILEKGQMSYRSFVSEIREPCIQQESNTDPTGLTRDVRFASGNKWRSFSIRAKKAKCVADWMWNILHARE